MSLRRSAPPSPSRRDHIFRRIRLDERRELGDLGQRQPQLHRQHRHSAAAAGRVLVYLPGQPFRQPSQRAQRSCW
jgi:hypothetical protein